MSRAMGLDGVPGMGTLERSEGSQPTPSCSPRSALPTRAPAVLSPDRYRQETRARALPPAQVCAWWWEGQHHLEAAVQ